MSKTKLHRNQITWWVMRLTAYLFIGLYFTFDEVNYPGVSIDLIGISLLLIGIVDSLWLLKRINRRNA